MLKHIALIASLGGIIALAGCNSARYVESEGTDTVVSLDQINIQDWSNAADQMVKSLVASGVLHRSPTQPAVLAISRIVNNTQQQVDTDELIKKIRVDLNRSGKVMTTTVIGLGDRIEDPLARSEAALAAEVAQTAPTIASPYFTLSGKLLETRARAGRTRQVTYTFQLSLTEIATGLAVWEDEVMITKAGSRPAVGW